MKIRFTGAGVLITGDPKNGFRAIGRGGIGELTEERAKCLVALGVASLDLRENLDEMTVLEPEELVDPDVLKRTGEMYTLTHREAVAAAERTKAARARLEAIQGVAR